MRILVTGVAGHIGSHLARAFLSQEHTVIGIDDLSGGELANVPFDHIRSRERLKFFQTDLANYPATEEIFQQSRPHIVYHCAANAREAASYFDPYRIVRQNGYISSIVFELAIKHGTEKIVYCSSMATFGDLKRLPFQENARRVPVDVYGEMKIATEHMLEMLSAAHGMKYTILLPHNVFGPTQSLRDPFRNLVTIQCNRIMRGEPLYLYGGGKSIRSFSYIEDCLPALVKAAQLDTANGERINIGGKMPIPVKHMTEKIVSCFPEYKVPEMVELPPRYGEVLEAYSSYEKSEQLLGYKELIGWEKGVEITAEWAKKKGPQEWREDKLAIPNESIPLPWKIQQERK